MVLEVIGDTDIDVGTVFQLMRREGPEVTELTRVAEIFVDSEETSDGGTMDHPNNAVRAAV